MDDMPSAQRVGRDADFLSLADANVAYGIHSSFGIHETSAIEHEIILLGGHNGGR
jgi:hypothetical protein